MRQIDGEGPDLLQGVGDETEFLRKVSSLKLLTMDPNHGNPLSPLVGLGGQDSAGRWPITHHHS